MPATFNTKIKKSATAQYDLDNGSDTNGINIK